MKTLIIYTHPNVEGHNSEILKAVTEKLTSKSVEFEILDLYKMNYDPVLHENELYTSGNTEITEQNKNIQKMITEADLLIFIYPVWAASMPAMLNGFMNKVFTPGFAYELGEHMPKGLLNKKALVFMTSGAPKIYYLLKGNIPKKVIKSNLTFCGIKPKIVHIGGCDKIDEKKKTQIRLEVESVLKCPFVPCG